MARKQSKVDYVSHIVRLIGTTLIHLGEALQEVANMLQQDEDEDGDEGKQ